MRRGRLLKWISFNCLLILDKICIFSIKETLQLMIHKVWAWNIEWSWTCSFQTQLWRSSWPSCARSKFMQRSRICNDVKCSLGKILSSSARSWALRGHLLLKKSFLPSSPQYQSVLQMFPLTTTVKFPKQGNYSLRRPPKLIIPQIVIRHCEKMSFCMHIDV